jgi:hypothetical protein
MIILVQQSITLSIQLSHHLSHSAVLARPPMGISKLIVRAPTRCTRADRAQTIDSYLSTVHAERIQICTGPAYLYIQVHIMYIQCIYIHLNVYDMYIHVYAMYVQCIYVSCSMYVPDHQHIERACPLH